MTVSRRISFDVFVSYRQRDPDRTWVRERLVPALSAAGLRIFVDYQSFRLGAPLVREMERAVEASRYTLAVLSPAYLESNFTDLERVMAQHLGVERSETRLVAVLLQPCTPPLSVRACLYLDMTDEARFDEQIAVLVEQLRQEPNM